MVVLGNFAVRRKSLADCADAADEVLDAPTDGISQLWLEQGLEMGRPSRIRLELNVDGGKLASARIGGHAIKVAEGTLFV